MDSHSNVDSLIEAMRTSVTLYQNCPVFDSIYQDINEYDEKAIDKFISDKNLLMQLRDLIDGINDWNLDSIESSLINFQCENNLSTPAVNQPIRIALTGSTKSPGLGLTLTFFKKNCIRKDG